MKQITTPEQFIETIYDYKKPTPTCMIQRNMLVLFSTTWCMPCKTYKPIIEKLGEDYTNLFTSFVVDAEVLQEVSEYMGISAVPTVMLFSKGKEVKTVNGLYTPTTLLPILREYFQS